MLTSSTGWEEGWKIKAGMSLFCLLKDGLRMKSGDDAKTPQFARQKEFDSRRCFLERIWKTDESCGLTSNKQGGQESLLFFSRPIWLHRRKTDRCWLVKRCVSNYQLVGNFLMGHWSSRLSESYSSYRDWMWVYMWLVYCSICVFIY